MYFINIHIIIQIFTYIAFFYIYKKYNLRITLFMDTLALVGGGTHETKIFVDII